MGAATITPQQLSSLLKPRTLERLGPAAKVDVWISARIRSPRKGERADLTLVSGRGKRLASRIRRAAAGSGAVLNLESAPADLEEGLEEGVILGPGSALWSAHLRVGITGKSYGRGEGEACLLLTQDRHVAGQIQAAARRRKIPLKGIIATGTDYPTSWQDLAHAAGRLSPVPPLLVALHRQLSLEDLALLLAHPRPPLLLLLGEAAGAVRWPDCAMTPPPTARELCHALGIALTAGPEELIAAARLMGAGADHVPSSPQVLIVGRTDGEVALLEETWSAASPPPGSRVEILQLDGRRRPLTSHGADLVLSGSAGSGGVLASPGSLATVTLGKDDHAAIAATLTALGSLARATAASEAGSSSPRVSTRAATRLLDSSPAILDELRSKELLGCYGLNPCPEELVTSASAASRVAGEVGLPVAVKPVGPDLRGRQEIGSVALDVDTPSAVRQAFRDVLLPLSGGDPPVLLEGVLVSAMTPLPAALDCTMVWLQGGSALLALSVRLAGGHLNGRQVLRCPLTPENARLAATRLASDGLWGGDVQPGAQELRRLTSLLERLSWMGPDLAGRMCWLRLDTVSPPRGKTEARVIDAHGEQTESMRNPGY